MSDNSEAAEGSKPSTSNSDETEEMMNIVVKTSKERSNFDIPSNADVKKLRELVSERYQIEPNAVCLIFSGKILKDGDLLQNHKMKDGHIVHLVIRDAKKSNPAGDSTSSQPTSSSSSSATFSNSTSSSSSTSTSNTTSSGATNPLSSMLSSMLGQGGIGGGGSPFGEFEQQFAQQLNNPELMRQMLDNPLMQNLYSNPDIFRSIITSNPQLQQLMERNPELNHLLSNPEILRQTFETIRNPAAFQEMMRSHDRALSNLESLPGGYNALQRMYTEFQEPMLNAAQEQFGVNSFSSSSTSTSTTTTNTPSNTENREPLPNPWDRSSNNSQNLGTASGNSATSNPASPFNLLGSGAMQSAFDQLASNPALIQNMLSNPAMQNMMQSIASDPNITNQIMSQLAGGAGANAATPAANRFPSFPSFLSGLNNPTNSSSSSSSLFQRISADPQAVQAVNQIQEGYAQLQRILGAQAANLNIADIIREFGAHSGVTSNSGANGTTSTVTTTPAVTSAGAVQTNTTASSLSGTQPTSTPTNVADAGAANAGPNVNAAALAQMMRQMFNMSAAQNQPAQPPEVRYQAQLTQLEQMGFTNREANLRALVETFGNVEAAIDRLLTRM